MSDNSYLFEENSPNMQLKLKLLIITYNYSFIYFVTYYTGQHAKRKTSICDKYILKIYRKLIKKTLDQENSSQEIHKKCFVITALF